MSSATSTATGVIDYGTQTRGSVSPWIIAAGLAALVAVVWLFTRKK